MTYYSYPVAGAGNVTVYSGFAEGQFVNTAGDTMTGLLGLSGDPVAALNPATKQYVDSADSTLSGNLSSEIDTDVAAEAAARSAEIATVSGDLSAEIDTDVAAEAAARSAEIATVSGDISNEIDNDIATYSGYVNDEFIDSSFISASGALITGSGTDIVTLPLGAENKVITSSGGTIVWADPQAVAGSGILRINELTADPQYLVVGSGGNAFAISSTGDTHTFSIPVAGSGIVGGLLTNASQSIYGVKFIQNDLRLDSATLTKERALVLAATGYLSSSPVTSGELGYLSGVSSAIQTQIDAKQDHVITTSGDIVVGSGATAIRLGIGNEDEVLSVDANGMPEWASAAASSPVTTSGDIVVGSGATEIRLGIGSEDEVLTVDANGMPEWAASQGASVLTTSGDILTHSGDAEIRLPVGSEDQVLTVNAEGIPAWEAPVGDTTLTTKGDVLYYNSGNQRLAVAASGSVFSVDGDGLPKWGNPTASGFLFDSDWTPSMSSSEGSVSNLVVDNARFIHVGNICFFTIGIQFELETAAATWISFTLPISYPAAPGSVNSIGNGQCENGGNPAFGFSWINAGYGDKVARTYIDGFTQWTIGAGKRIKLTGHYITDANQAID